MYILNILIYFGILKITSKLLCTPVLVVYYILLITIHFKYPLFFAIFLI